MEELIYLKLLEIYHAKVSGKALSSKQFYRGYSIIIGLIDRGDLKIEDKTFIAFLDDDNTKQEDWVELKEKTVSFVSFIYKFKLVTIPWHRVLKIKEVDDD